MTSESDSTSGRRPPTIELKATEVEPAKAQSAAAEATAEAAAKADTPEQKASAEQRPTEEKSDSKPAAKSATRLLAHAVSAVIGAIAAVAVLAGLWLAGFNLARDVVTSQSATPEATAPDRPNAEIAARLDKIERAMQAPKPEAATIPAALGNRLTAVEMQVKTLGDAVAALNHRADDIAAAAQRAQQRAAGAASTADAAKSAQANVQPADVAALANRIAALENAVKTLSDQVAHPVAATDQAARFTVAAEALRAALERGAPYQAELKALQSLGADQHATAPLEAFAATGLPRAETLALELAALVPALRQATETSPGDATFLSKLKAHAQNLIQITPVDAPPGNDPASVITRIDVDAHRDDIAAALNDIAALPESAKPLAADWAEKAKARETALAASRNIAADALSALSKPAAQ